MQKRISLIEQKTGSVVILVIKEIASYNRLRLANLRVNFIIPGKQMFLPALLVNFREEPNRDEDLPKSIPPVAQALLPYHLQVGSIEGLDAKTLADRLHVSYASANRAISWLTEKGIIETSDGKTKLIEVREPKKALWQKALPFLDNLIEKVVYTDEILDAPKSGINALAGYTMINKEAVESYALSKAKLKNLSVSVKMSGLGQTV